MTTPTTSAPPLDARAITALRIARRGMPVLALVADPIGVRRLIADGLATLDGHNYQLTPAGLTTLAYVDTETERWHAWRDDMTEHGYIPALARTP